MEANEISLDLEYEKRDENGKLEYEGISFVEDEFPAFLKQTISPISVSYTHLTLPTKRIV